MAKQLSLDDLLDQITRLAEVAKADAVRDILIDLEESFKQGPLAEDDDSWHGGFRAAIETIALNYTASK